MTLSDTQAFCLCARLVSVSQILACAEMLMRDGVLRPDGMLSWDIMRLRSGRYLDPRWEAAFNWLYGYPRVRLLLMARLCVAAVVLGAPNRWVLAPVLLPLLAVSDLLFALRADFGNDGSDQMTAIVTVSLAVASIIPRARVVALGFLAFQACLAYGVAGWAKARQKQWWNGDFAIGVSRTDTFGVPAFGEHLARHRFLAAALSSGMVAWELSFPFILFAPLPLALAVLAVGVIFHIVNAFHMGLNTFLWAFGSTYPALIYILTLRGF